MPFYVEEDAEENEQKIYESLLVKDPKLFTILSTELAQRILQVLSKQPSSAMDVARKLKQHEQKIYYHFRNLERAGLIKLIKTEKRVGAVAKIYAAQYPVVSFKLFNHKSISGIKTKANEVKFFEPFLDNGKLNAIIVVGSPDPHGKYGAQASDGIAAIDIALFLGHLTRDSPLPNYKLDTEMKEEDYKNNNLILVGGPKTNNAVERINKSMPLYFDYHREWNIVSPFSKQVYVEEDIGILAKMKNPFNEEKHVLVIAGKRFKGTKAGILALLKNLKEVEKGNRFDSSVVAKIVQGIDRNADGKIDDVRFLE